MVTFGVVQNQNEVFINGVTYRLTRPVQTRLGSQYPTRQITGTGEITSDSDPTNSVHTWNDWRGGIGVDRMILGEDNRRSFISFCATEIRNQLTKAPLATQTAAADSGVTGNPLLGQLGGNIVAAYNTAVQQYIHGTNTWEATVRTLTATPTDVLNLTTRLSTSETLIFCFTSGYDYSSAIATWAASSKNTVKMTSWLGRLWGIDAVGQLWYSWTIGSNETDNALLNLAQGDVITGLFTGRDPTGHTIIYCTTERSLYAHDFDNCQWVEQNVPIAPEGLTAANHTRKAVAFQDQMYLASNASIINYVARGGEATVASMGFDEDDGLPSASFENIVSCMAASVKDLIVGTDVVSSNDTALVLAWNPKARGWRILWEADATNTPLISLHISFIGSYRGWFGYNNRVWWIQLNHSNANPKQIEGWTYDTGDNIHKTPWFDAGQHEVDLTAVELIIDLAGLSANETVRVAWAIDYDDSTYISRQWQRGQYWHGLQGTTHQTYTR